MSSLQLNIASLAKNLVSICLENNVTFGTAESCTGGLISASVTDIAGASAVFFGGIVSYDNSVKKKLLGVPSQTLDEKGAVSPETAGAMSAGARRALGVDYAVAVTGFAGPGGDHVGLVYISVATPDRILVTENHFAGNREAVRLQTVEKALSLLISEIEK